MWHCRIDVHAPLYFYHGCHVNYSFNGGVFLYHYSFTYCIQSSDTNWPSMFGVCKGVRLYKCSILFLYRLHFLSTFVFVDTIPVATSSSNTWKWSEKHAKICEFMYISSFDHHTIVSCFTIQAIAIMLYWPLQKQEAQKCCGHPKRQLRGHSIIKPYLH